MEHRCVVGSQQSTLDQPQRVFLARALIIGGGNDIIRFFNVLPFCSGNNLFDKVPRLGQWDTHDQCRLDGSFGKIQVCRPLGIMIFERDSLHR